MPYVYANMNRARNSPAYKMSDFLPSYDDGPGERPKTTGELRDKIDSVMFALGGR